MAQKDSQKAPQKGKKNITGITKTIKEAKGARLVYS